MEKLTLSWRRAASPGKRYLGVLPRGALRVLQGSAIGGDERPGEILVCPLSRGEPLVASRPNWTFERPRKRGVPLLALSSWCPDTDGRRPPAKTRSKEKVARYSRYRGDRGGEPRRVADAFSVCHAQISMYVSFECTRFEQQ